MINMYNKKNFSRYSNSQLLHIALSKIGAISTTGCVFPICIFLGSLYLSTTYNLVVLWPYQVYLLFSLICLILFAEWMLKFYVTESNFQEILTAKKILLLCNASFMTYLLLFGIDVRIYSIFVSFVCFTALMICFQFQSISYPLADTFLKEIRRRVGQWRHEYYVQKAFPKMMKKPNIPKIIIVSGHYVLPVTGPRQVYCLFLQLIFHEDSRVTVSGFYGAHVSFYLGERSNQFFASIPNEYNSELTLSECTDLLTTLDMLLKHKQKLGLFSHAWQLKLTILTRKPIMKQTKKFYFAMEDIHPEEEPSRRFVFELLSVAGISSIFKL